MKWKDIIIGLVTRGKDLNATKNLRLKENSSRNGRVNRNTTQMKTAQSYPTNSPNIRHTIKEGEIHKL